MKYKKKSRMGVFLLFMLFSCNFCLAEIVNIKLEDVRNGVYDGGPIIEGYVDTATDVFYITSWSEDPDGQFHYTPDLSDLTVFPNGKLEMIAIDSNGDPYDVPDNFDGSIGDTWGFSSPLTLDEIPWNEGELNFPGAVGTWLSWGMYVWSPGGVKTIYPDPGFGSTTYDNAQYFGYTPYSGDDANANGEANRATAIWMKFPNTIPEPNTTIFLILSILFFMGKRIRIYSNKSLEPTP